MSVYDRAMFRGSRSTGQPVKQATQVLSQKVGEKVMSDAMGGIASAKDPVELMNAMRGDQRTMKERRQELGGIVGMKDANKTPESVVTLVQPVLQMREAQGSVDQGIGQVAQKAMSSPVTDAVQKGIMQPLKMNKGGASSLQALYQQNLPLIQEIYGGDADADKKQALANLLLGGLAPAGLAIAQGTPVAEALMPIGPMLATSGASVKQAKDKRDLAARSAALQMAQSQLSDSKKLTQLDPEKDTYRGGELISKGVKKFEPLSLMNQEGQVQTANTREEEVAMRQKGFVFTPTRAEKFKPLTLMNKQGQFETAFSRAEEANMRRRGFVLTPERLDEFKQITLQNKDGDARTATNPTEEAAMRLDGYIFSPQRDKPFEPVSLMNKDGDIQTANSLEEETQIRSQGYVFTPQKDKPFKPVSLMNKDGVVETANNREEEISLREKGFVFNPKQDTEVKDTFKTIYPNVDITLTDGTVLKKNQPYMLPFETRQQLQIGTYSDKEPPQSQQDKVTVSIARKNLEDLSKKVLDGDRDRDTLFAFDTNLAALVNNRSFGFQMTGEGGGLVNIPEQVPSYAIDALKAIKEGTEGVQAMPDFGDYGLLAVEEEVTEFPEVTIIKGTEDFSEANLGATGLIKRAIDKVVVPTQNLFLGESQEAFPGALKAVKTINAVNDYAVGVFISAVGRQNQNLIDAFRGTLPSPTSILESATSQASSASRTADRLDAQKTRLSTELSVLSTAASNNKKRAELSGKIKELEALAKNYRLLANMLRGRTSSDSSQQIKDPDQMDAYIFGRPIQ